MVRITTHVKDNGLVQKLEKKEEAARKAMRATVSDLKRRAPAKVAQAVTQVYAIKQADVKPGGKLGGGGKIQTSGETIESFALTYTGGLLTSLHFKQTPQVKPGNSRKYTIKATIKKGSKVEIGHWSKPHSEGGAYARPADSPYFLAGANGGNILPMQRQGDQLGKVFKTVSIPQMVGNDEVADNAMQSINELADERLNHHLQRFLK